MKNGDTSEDRLKQFTYEDTRCLFLKRRKEMKAIHSYIRSKKQWNDFEKMFMRLYGESIREADTALKLLGEFPFTELRRKAIEERTLCHGDFNYHQVILNRKYTAIINFDRMHVDIQVTDLYQFLRKVMKKIIGIRLWDF